MLVLHRKEKESLSIGDSVQVVVTRIQRNSVSLGIQAPKNTLILRDEIPVAQKSLAILPPSGVFQDGWLFGAPTGMVVWREEPPIWGEKGDWNLKSYMECNWLHDTITWRFPAHLTTRECLVAVGPKVEGL